MSTYGLDSKDILKLDKGVSSNVVTVIPDSVATDVVALGPALAASPSAGVIPFRESGVGGQLKAVTVTSPLTFINGVLTGPTARTLPELFEGWKHNSNPGRVEAIELEDTGMKRVWLQPRLHSNLLQQQISGLHNTGPLQCGILGILMLLVLLT